MSVPSLSWLVIVFQKKTSSCFDIDGGRGQDKKFTTALRTKTNRCLFAQSMCANENSDMSARPTRVVTLRAEHTTRSFLASSAASARMRGVA
jgi:hypothetical protein